MGAEKAGEGPSFFFLGPSFGHVDVRALFPIASARELHRVCSGSSRSYLVAHQFRCRTRDVRGSQDVHCADNSGVSCEGL